MTFLEYLCSVYAGYMLVKTAKIIGTCAGELHIKFKNDLYKEEE